jgi:hypothetical protein
MTHTSKWYNPKEYPMTYEYDFEMVKRAYAEMARRAREKDEVRRPSRNAAPQVQQQESESSVRQPMTA